MTSLVEDAKQAGTITPLVLGKLSLRHRMSLQATGYALEVHRILPTGQTDRVLDQLKVRDIYAGVLAERDQRVAELERATDIARLELLAIARFCHELEDKDTAIHTIEGKAIAAVGNVSAAMDVTVKANVTNVTIFRD